MQTLGILATIVVLVGGIALYYYFFDPMAIDEEEEHSLEDETPRERAQVLAEHERKIEEAKIEEEADAYSEQ